MSSLKDSCPKCKGTGEVSFKQGFFNCSHPCNCPAGEQRTIDRDWERMLLDRKLEVRAGTMRDYYWFKLKESLRESR